MMRTCAPALTLYFVLVRPDREAALKALTIGQSAGTRKRKCAERKRPFPGSGIPDVAHSACLYVCRDAPGNVMAGYAQELVPQ